MTTPSTGAPPGGKAVMRGALSVFIGNAFNTTVAPGIGLVAFAMGGGNFLVNRNLIVSAIFLIVSALFLGHATYMARKRCVPLKQVFWPFGAGKTKSYWLRLVGIPASAGLLLTVSAGAAGTSVVFASGMLFLTVLVIESFKTPAEKKNYSRRARWLERILAFAGLIYLLMQANLLVIGEGKPVHGKLPELASVHIGDLSVGYNLTLGTNPLIVAQMVGLVLLTIAMMAMRPLTAAVQEDYCAAAGIASRDDMTTSDKMACNSIMVGQFAFPGAVVFGAIAGLCIWFGWGGAPGGFPNIIPALVGVFVVGAVIGVTGYSGNLAGVSYGNGLKGAIRSINFAFLLAAVPLNMLWDYLVSLWQVRTHQPGAELNVPTQWQLVGGVGMVLVALAMALVEPEVRRLLHIGGYTLVEKTERRLQVQVRDNAVVRTGLALSLPVIARLRTELARVDAVVADLDLFVVQVGSVLDGTADNLMREALRQRYVALGLIGRHDALPWHDQPTLAAITAERDEQRQYRDAVRRKLDSAVADMATERAILEAGEKPVVQGRVLLDCWADLQRRLDEGDAATAAGIVLTGPEFDEFIVGSGSGSGSKVDSLRSTQDLLDQCSAVEAALKKVAAGVALSDREFNNLNPGSGQADEAKPELPRRRRESVRPEFAGVSADPAPLRSRRAMGGARVGLDGDATVLVPLRPRRELGGGTGETGLAVPPLPIRIADEDRVLLGGPLFSEPSAREETEPAAAVLGAPEETEPATVVLGAPQEPEPAAVVLGAPQEPEPAAAVLGAPEEPVLTSVGAGARQDKEGGSSRPVESTTQKVNVFEGWL